MPDETQTARSSNTAARARADVIQSLSRWHRSTEPERPKYSLKTTIRGAVNPKQPEGFCRGSVVRVQRSADSSGILALRNGFNFLKLIARGDNKGRWGFNLRLCKQNPRESSYRVCLESLPQQGLASDRVSRSVARWCAARAPPTRQTPPLCDHLLSGRRRGRDLKIVV